MFRFELPLLQRDFQEEVTADLCKVQDLVIEVFFKYLDVLIITVVITMIMI
jgi:hypothetical protein